MWATCINELAPAECQLKEEVPKFLVKAFNAAGISEQSAMVYPVRPIRFLGSCSTGLYLDCPNIPEEHIDLFHDCGGDDDPANYDIGKYHWFDFDIVGLDGAVVEARLVFNEGDADCNDGLWGAVWERNTEALIANITNDVEEATVAVASQRYADMYESQDIWIPTDFDKKHGYDPLPCGSMRYANNLKLEKIIGLAIRLCSACRSRRTYTRFCYDE
ncbi:MAG: hypothetical protein KME13_19705 [Myxacorys californica WJT36-NPBG1]|jgi:hypothetical protein|nr:hypothetical protein [Myxacorys californica WJT36-NPBG1]